MAEQSRVGQATVRTFDERALDGIVAGSAGCFAGTTPATVEAAVAQLRAQARDRGIALSVTMEGPVTVVRATRQHVDDATTPPRAA